MVDVQSFQDDRHIAIQKVGVKGLRYPITLLDKTEKYQHTTAVVNLYANLPRELKGTHMSRFIEVFDEYRHDLSMPNVIRMLRKIRTELDAQSAYTDIHFPYFINKAAPVSGQTAIMSYDCFYEASCSEKGHRFIAGVIVPVQTVCPCSKAISDGGAHNQRGLVTLQVSLGPFFWFEDLIRIVEESGSSELFTLLKREDEKFITEKAYSQPRFVEDVVREVYLKVDALNRFPWFSVEAENFESIHNHSAYAYVEKSERSKIEPVHEGHGKIDTFMLD
ncbi:MAG: GTP cyclohydrolase FolE2 [Spirochaetia bacterium]|jgi:GTP cyclohydrolase I|uniref:GTP cyclohydrolase FolE2 n=1 Tax=uncultured spirochete TaxID=156406 RepID=A0A3P3XGY4_9SPIR|nr:GTP cyclohydrolase FolE2 [Rectinema subterraneum]MDQ7796244.1 GTP cyclohydrolase FolE2 [Spirochaetia bacterium]SLM10190.1 GTP cyclohydrolase FolE2 [uncultured spirochete]HBE46307.1 GTP cyclohydrolase I FolE2 [Spirochaetaceae bacterium]